MKAIQFIKDNKWIIVGLVALAILVYLPIVINSDGFLVINNDTAAHLEVFKNMQNGDTQFLYFGQKVTGYIVNFISGATGLSIEAVFMWFNFTSLFLCGIAAFLLTLLVTSNKYVSMLSGFIIVFGLGATQQLFLSGTIFNVIEVLILLPIVLIPLYKTLSSKKKFLTLLVIPIMVLVIFFHPSLGTGIKTLFTQNGSGEAVLNPFWTVLNFFGITNFILLVICIVFIIATKTYIKMKLAELSIIGILSLLSIVLSVLSSWNFTPFSSRMAMNACLVSGLLLCILFGYLINYAKPSNVKLLYILPAISIVPNIVNWITYSIGKESLCCG